MWPLLLFGTLAAGLVGGTFNQYSAKEKNKAITNIITQLDTQKSAQLGLLTEREKQIEAQANLAKTERLTQLYKQIGAQAAWAAAQGLQGGGLQRLQGVEKADATKDINIIQTNLENYLSQLAAEREALEAEVDVRKSQLEAGKENTRLAFWSGLLNTSSNIYNIGSQFLI